MEIVCVAAVYVAGQFAKMRPKLLVTRAKSSATSPELSLLKKELQIFGSQSYYCIHIKSTTNVEF